jgi:L-alanine-DL-glutamate epimerase-like enolase superfamily enzyme
VEAVDRLAPQCDIYLDANQGFSADEMLKILRQLQRRGIRPALLEQPVHRDDYEGLCKMTRSTDIPVCADESVRSLEEAARILKDKAAGVINIKLMKFGMMQAFEIARMTRACGAELMIGGMLESSLAMTASAHLAAGFGGFRYIDLDTPFFIRDEAEQNPFLSSRGVYDLREAKGGIGIQKGVQKGV